MFGTRHARLTASGSAANLLAFASLTSPLIGDTFDKPRIRPGDEVLTVAAGFPTTVAPIVQHGCVPVFVDVDPETHNVDVAKLREAVTPRTRAVMIAHSLGNPFDLDAVTALCRDHGLWLIEDCCDAFGATYKGKGVGTFGDAATLSFHPAHHITMGEGGAVMTDHGGLKRIIESLRDWVRDCWYRPGKDNTCNRRFDWQLGELPLGYDHKYIHSHLGYNLKVSDMQAAVGLSQLEKLPGFIAKRRVNFRAFTEAFRDGGLEEHFILPKAAPGSDPSWFGHQLTIRDGSRLKCRDVVKRLEDRRIETRLLFAGGTGARLSDKTDRIPEPTATIGGKPILGHVMTLHGSHGTNDIVIRPAHGAHVVKERLHDHFPHGCDVTPDLESLSMKVTNHQSEPS